MLLQYHILAHVLVSKSLTLAKWLKILTRNEDVIPLLKNGGLVCDKVHIMQR